MSFFIPEIEIPGNLRITNCEESFGILKKNIYNKHALNIDLMFLLCQPRVFYPQDKINASGHGMKNYISPPPPPPAYISHYSNLSLDYISKHSIRGFDNFI